MCAVAIVALPWGTQRNARHTTVRSYKQADSWVRSTNLQNYVCNFIHVLICRHRAKQWRNKLKRFVSAHVQRRNGEQN
jgi:hypothetical protein